MSTISTMNKETKFPMTVGVVLYKEFELLDVYGPLEMFGLLPDYFELVMLAEKEGSVQSTQGPKSVVDKAFSPDDSYDILLIPGGRGTDRELENEVMLEFLRKQAETTQYMTSVCTGSALFAKAGLLDGRKATTNKLYFKSIIADLPTVEWVAEARWVEDGKFFTSSGVSAGMDMTLALIAQLVGEDLANQAANAAEYNWQKDASYDPFAKLHNLV